jgi:hypothetical protein
MSYPFSLSGSAVNAVNAGWLRDFFVLWMNQTSACYYNRNEAQEHCQI